MFRGPVVLGLIALLALPAAGRAAVPGHLPGEILVRFRADPAGAGSLSPNAVGAPGVRAVRPTFAGPIDEAAAPVPGGRRVPGTGATAPAPDFLRTLTLEIDPGLDPEAAAREWAARPDVEFAAPIRLLPLLSTATPNDPDLSRQWHHDAIGSRTAWARTTGDPRVVIAIVDTGLDLEHPDLAPNLWVNAAEASGLPGVDDDGNGYVDDRNGFDFTDVPEVVGAGDFAGRDPDPDDDIGHGTWVAGMAVAAGDNGVDGAGVAYGCRVMPLRAGFLPRSGFSLGFLAEDDAAAAIVYAVDNGARVINLSFGDLVRAPLLEDAVRYAVQRDVVVVAAAGNNGDDAPFYPAGLAGVLAVGASTAGGGRASFSTYGPAVTLLAPGSQVWTTERGGGLEARSGTSLAAPVAAGAAALLVSRHDDWTAGRVIDALVGTAAPVPGGAGRGAGLLRLDRAIDAAGDVVVALHGLDDGAAVADTLRIAGTAAGGAVRGWRVLVRPESGGAWRTLAAATSGQAFAEPLATWPVARDAEGDWIVRLEALGLDRVVGAREARVTIDRTPPLVTDIELLPALSGAGYGVRASARADEPVFGRLELKRLSSGDDQPPREFRTISATTRPIVGLDADLADGAWRVELTWRDRAGNVTAVVETLDIPGVGVEPSPPSGWAPSAASWLPRLVDLDGDGALELVGESWERGGGFYGRVRAWRPQLVESNDCAATPAFTVAWTGTEAFIPRDFGDFDGDGRGDLLGQGLQAIRVVGSSVAGNFPDQVIAASGEAWASRFVPSPDGPGLDIVASRDSEIRIYRRGAAGLELASRLVNPGDGLNAISPAIELLSTPGGVPGLATVDSDGDLLVAERPAADFEWTVTGRRFEPGAALGAADVDGDGVSELAVMEPVGDIPSPAAGLRDGYLRLTLLERRGAGDWSPRQVLGLAGHFPGNPMHVQGVPVRGGAREALWVGAGGRLWRLVLEETSGELRPVRVVEGAGDGPLAWGLDSAGDGREFVVFPSGSGASEAPGALCFGPMLVEAGSTSGFRSAIRDLRARAASGSSGIAIALRWSDIPGARFQVGRGPIDAPEEFEVLAEGLEVPEFVDGSADEGRSYRYTVGAMPGEPVVSATLPVVVRPRNPVVTAAFESGLLRVEWTDPVRLSESAAIDIEDGPRFEALHLVAGGRGLVASLPAEGPAPSGAFRVRVSGLVSESGLDLADVDAVLHLDGESGGRPLRLVRAWAVDAETFGVELEPGVPLSAAPVLFELLDGRGAVVAPVISVTPADARRLHLRVAERPRAGDYRIRMRFGASAAPNGTTEVPLRLGPVVYPNPVRAGAAAARFQWLAAGDRVYLFDMTGREIWRGEADGEGRLEWPLVGADDQAVSPGIYLYRVEGAWEGSGKIAVLR